MQCLKERIKWWYNFNPLKQKEQEKLESEPSIRHNKWMENSGLIFVSRRGSDQSQN